MVSDESPLGSPPKSLPRSARAQSRLSTFSESNASSMGSPPKSMLLGRASLGELPSAGGALSAGGSRSAGGRSASARRDSAAAPSTGGSAFYESCADSSSPLEARLSPPKSLKHAAQRGRLSAGGSSLGMPSDDTDDDAADDADGPTTPGAPSALDFESAAPAPAAEAPAALTPRRGGLRSTPARQQRHSSGEPGEAPRSAGRKSAGGTKPAAATAAIAETAADMAAANAAAATELAAAISAPAAASPAAKAPALPKTPRSACKGARAAAAASAPSAVAPLKLDNFPATFQHGAAAEQLRLLHATLRAAPAPLSVRELGEALHGKFETQRITLLLEVMASRHVVSVDGNGRERRFTSSSVAAGA